MAPEVSVRQQVASLRFQIHELERKLHQLDRSTSTYAAATGQKIEHREVAQLRLQIFHKRLELSSLEKAIAAFGDEPTGSRLEPLRAARE